MKTLGQMFRGIMSGVTSVWQTVSSNPQNFAAFLNFLQGKSAQQGTATWWSGITGTQTGQTSFLPILLIGGAIVVLVVLLRR